MRFPPRYVVRAHRNSFQDDHCQERMCDGWEYYEMFILRIEANKINNDLIDIIVFWVEIIAIN
jgi:hypothetical protein